MATSFLAPSDGVPTTKVVACDATAGNLEAVTVTGQVDVVTLYFVGGAGKYSHTGTDAAAIGSDYQIIPGDQLVEIRFPSGTISPTFYLAHTVAGGSCYVSAERVA